MTIRGVCFDATGTLIEPAESIGETYSRAAREAGVRLPAWRLDDAFQRVLRQAPPLGEAGATGATQSERETAEIAWWRERVRQTFQAADSTVRFADAEGLFGGLFAHYRRPEAWRLRPGAREVLARLQREGCALGLASNFDHRLPDILEGLDLARFFSFVTIPSRSGAAKPDPRVIEAVGRALGLPLASLAYVGDDAPEVLASIARQGLLVVDVADCPDLAALPARLRPDAGDGAAKLASNVDPLENGARREVIPES
ncbi:MAG: HAD family hydrolase [Myxococcota bacterium]